MARRPAGPVPPGPPGAAKQGRRAVRKRQQGHRAWGGRKGRGCGAEALSGGNVSRPMIKDQSCLVAVLSLSSPHPIRRESSLSGAVCQPRCKRGRGCASLCGELQYILRTGDICGIVLYRVSNRVCTTETGPLVQAWVLRSPPVPPPLQTRSGAVHNLPAVISGDRAADKGQRGPA